MIAAISLAIKFSFSPIPIINGESFLTAYKSFEFSNNIPRAYDPFTSFKALEIASIGSFL